MSLAAGVCPETEPAAFVTAAAAAGWPACGIWFDADTWTDAVARDVRQRLDDTGVVALDMEPIFVTPDGDDVTDHGDRVIEAAAAVGARNLLIVSRGVSDAQFTDRFAELCDAAGAHGIGCSIEFLAFMSVSSLPQTLGILDAVDRPNGNVLVDHLHLERTGGTVADVAQVDPARLAYVQLCDIHAADPPDVPSMITEALDLRLNVGDGDLAVQELIDVLPEHTALSFEIRSAALRRDFPDPADRARHVLEATRSALASS